jgi:hypothetical protein
MQGILRGDPTFGKNFNPHLPAKGYGGIPKAQDGMNWNFQGAQQPQFTTPESVGLQPDPIYKTQMQDTGAPPVSGNMLPQGQEQQYKITQKFKNKLDPEAAVNWGLAGASMLASAFEQREAKKNEEKWKALQGADAQFYAQEAGDRGKWYNGKIQPNAMVPVQFAGQNNGQMGSPYQFQEGGEYYMTDDQINAIMQAGGEIDFLD